MKIYIKLRQSGEVKEVESIIRNPSKELSAHYFDRIDKDGCQLIGGIPLTACDLCDKQGRLLVAEDEVGLDLLKRAEGLIGNLGTNISSSCDEACQHWQDDFDKWKLTNTPSEGKEKEKK